VRYTIPGTVAGIAVDGLILPYRIIAGTFGISQLGFRNGDHIFIPVSGQFHTGKCCFPDSRRLHIRFRIGPAGHLMGMLLLAAADLITRSRVGVVFRGIAADRDKFRLSLFKTGFSVDMTLGGRFCADKHRFHRLRGFRLPFLQAAAQHVIPLIAGILMGMTGILRGLTDKHLPVAGCIMDMVLHSRADQFCL